MGFLGNPIKKIGGALSKLPGAKTLNKPVNKLMGQTPGLRGVPQKLGMAGPKKPVSPIAPSPNIMEGAIGAGTAAMGNPGPKPMGQEMPQVGAPMGQSPPFMPPTQGPPQLENGGMQMSDLASMIPQQQPQEMQSLAAPQMQPQQMPQVNPQMNNMMAKMRQRNTGVTGGRMGPIAQKSGIGPSFMG